jgi:hypothetical protein
MLAGPPDERTDLSRRAALAIRLAEEVPRTRHPLGAEDRWLDIEAVVSP